MEKTAEKIRATYVSMNEACANLLRNINKTRISMEEAAAKIAEQLKRK